MTIRLALFKQVSEKPPYLLELRTSKVFICGVVSVAVFTDIFLYGVIVPVIPFAIGGQVHVAPDRVQYWVSVLVAIYGAALLAFSPICGYVADHTSSRRSSLLCGLFALAGATIMLNIGHSIAILIIGRVLQGISAAVVWVVGLALIVDTVGPAAVGYAIGYVSVAMSMGILLAPMLGGLVFAHAGYNAVFGMAYGLIALDILLRLVLIERKIAMRWETEEEDPVGPVSRRIQSRDSNTTPEIVTTCDSDPEKLLTAGTNGRNDGTTHAPSEPNIPLQEPHTHSLRTRLPPIITLLSSYRLLASLWGIMAQASLMTSFDSVLPLFVKRTFHWNSAGAGLIFLALMIPAFLQPLVGYLSDRYGPRYPATFGFVLGIPLYICLRFVTGPTLSSKVLLCALLALVGIAMSFALAPLVAEVSYVVADEEKRLVSERGRENVWGGKGAYAQAYGLFNMAFAAGCLVGPIWGGMVVQEAGWGTMCWSMGLLNAAAALPIFLFVGGWIGNKAETDTVHVDRD